MMSFQIEKIYLDEKAEKDWVAQAVLKSLPHLPVERVTDKKTLIKAILSKQDPIGTGKKNLFITRFYGRRLKPCPGTSRHLCCGYHVINALTNCPMDCSYCVLQGYLNNPFLTLYSNWDELLREIEAFLSRIILSCPDSAQGNSRTAWPSIRSFPSPQGSSPFLRKNKKGFSN